MSFFYYEISSPWFLIAYLIVLVVCFSWLHKWRYRNFVFDGDDVNVKLAKFSSYEVALLRDAERGPADVALFELWRAGLVETHAIGDMFWLKNKANNARQLSAIASEAHKLLEQPISFKEFGARLANTPLMQNFSALVNQKLFEFKENIQTVVNQNRKEKARKEHATSKKVIVWIGVLLLLPGILMFWHNIRQEKPIYLLGAELFLVTFLAVRMWLSECPSFPLITIQGEKIVQALKRNNIGLLTGRRDRFNAADDMSLAIALFGRAGVGGVPAFISFYELLRAIDTKRRHE